MFRLRRRAGHTRPTRLHVGCGVHPIEGWCNIDIQRLRGVDIVMDVTKGFDFRGVRLIFCEHFIEHLRLDATIRFLYRCHDALETGGVLRLSTPNLDWVIASQYDANATQSAQRIEHALMLNRAFHGWGHQFLYNGETLSYLLQAAGFDPVYPCEYGVSPIEELCNLERHERFDAPADLPDVLVLEAVRASDPDRTPLEHTLGDAHEHFLRFLDWKVRS